MSRVVILVLALALALAGVTASAYGSIRPLVLDPADPHKDWLESNDYWSQPQTGTVTTANGHVGPSDRWDVYPLELREGEEFSFQMYGDSDADVDLMLYAPSCTDLYADVPLRQSSVRGYPERVTYRVPAGQGGTYFLVAWCFTGDGRYTISMRDRLVTRVTLRPDSIAIPYGGRVAGNVSVGTVAPSSPATVSVALQRSTDGRHWTTFQTRSLATSGTAARWADTSQRRTRTFYRAYFGGDAYRLPVSQVVTVKPRVGLSRPNAPSRLRHGVAFTAYGTINVWHPNALGTVRVRAFRMESGVWRLRAIALARLTDRATGSGYSARVVLPSKGIWLLKAWHPSDALHASSSSVGRIVTCR